MPKLKNLVFLLSIALLLSACGKALPPNPVVDDSKLLYNVLELAKRPFLLLSPHSSNRLIALYLDRVDPGIKSSTIDIDYLAGSSLKGGRVSPSFPISLPHTQAFLLGSCSTGGKCSFDSGLTSGTVKTRLNFENGEAHVLKSNYSFVNGTTSTADGRLLYTPKSTKTTSQILLDTQGLPAEFGGELSLGPIAITSTSEKSVEGKLEIKASDVKSVKYFDGKVYLNQPATITADSVSITLNHAPWHKEASITRDDQKGIREPVDLYVVGPFLMVK